MKFKNQTHLRFEEEDTINFEVFRHNTNKPISKLHKPQKKGSKQSAKSKNMSKKIFKRYSEIKWYDQEKMSWPKNYMEKLIHHSVDFDEESDEDVIERAVEKGVADLVEEITFQKIFALEDTQGF